MNTHSTQFKSSGRFSSVKISAIWKIVGTLGLAFLLTPLSMAISEEGTSMNYFFVLIFLFSKAGHRYSRAGSIYLALLIMCYLFGLLFVSNGEPLFITRQAVSFIVALLPVSLLFTRLTFDSRDLSNGIIVAALAYSIYAFFCLFFYGFSLTDIYEIKGGLREYITDWPQRYIIIVILAALICIENFKESLQYKALTICFITLIFFTFTRAAYLATFFGWLACMFCSRAQNFVSVRRSHIAQTFQIVLYILLFLLLVVALTNTTINQALSTMLSSIFDSISTGMSGGFTVDDDSESTRLTIWSAIIDILIEYFAIFGTGHAGIYLLRPEFGSAHNQYFDILLRTGLAGFTIYVYLWGVLLVRLFRSSPGLFGGMFAILIFGIFHETTKLSYGALVFFLLLSMSEQGLIIRRQRFSEIRSSQK